MPGEIVRIVHITGINACVLGCWAHAGVMEEPPWLSGKALWLTRVLKERGLSTVRIRDLVNGGSLVRLRRGCYMHHSRWSCLSTEQQGIQMIYAHRLVTAAAAVSERTYSHTSAARVHGLHLWNEDVLIHVTQQAALSSASRAPDVRVHQSRLSASEVVEARGMRITSLERTVVDCSRILPHKSALILAEHGLRLGADRTVMEQAIRERPGHKGIQRARRVLDVASPLSESPGETLALHAMRVMRLPMPEQQLVVHTRHGRHRLDFGWRERKVALEFDGKAKYFEYRPTEQALFEERRREKALMEEGWTFLRIEWNDVFDEVRLKERILRAFARSDERMVV